MKKNIYMYVDTFVLICILQVIDKLINELFTSSFFFQI